MVLLWEEKQMMNVNYFAQIEKELVMAEKGSNQFEAVLSRYTGPERGVEWDDETKKLSIAPGWHADPNGNVVRD